MAPLKETLWLVRNNVPVDMAFALDDVTRAAWCIIFSEFEGRSFDVDRMRWKSQE